jgi:signal transduction histidine kinase
LPKALLRRDLPPKKQELDLVMGSFQEVAGEIKSLREQLIVRERLATLGEISAGIAHEFRNPMGVIAGYGRLLLKSLDDNDQRKDLVQGILSEVDTMNRIMEELLKFSRSEPVTKIPVDLSNLLAEVVQGYGENRNRIKLSVPEHVVAGGDETLLRQAVKNLVQNAVDTGSEVRVDVQRAMMSGKESLCITVSDNGPGIPADDLKKIFTPFYTTRPEGIGIGLPLVQKIAIAHGGTVEVESLPGTGSTFRLCLPAA